MNYKLILFFAISVPPQTPVIFDGTARELSGIAGPYKEGDPMTLTCIASGGLTFNIQFILKYKIDNFD